MIKINNITYTLIEEQRDAWNEEAFLARYSDVLEKYDYVVGDWGYEQLRLTGFYRNNQEGVPADRKISSLQDFLLEYCNFSSPYFVLERAGSPKKKVRRRRRRKVGEDK
jgi:uncharacterized protein YutD